MRRSPARSFLNRRLKIDHLFVQLAHIKTVIPCQFSFIVKFFEFLSRYGLSNSIDYISSVNQLVKLICRKQQNRVAIVT